MLSLKLVLVTIWNKWEDAVEIIYGKNGVTGQSMELSDNYKGVYDGEFFEFTEFQFFGACMLGDDVLPAMNNSTVELKYASKTKDIIKEKMELFNSISFSSTEGGNTLSKEDLKKYEDNEEVAVDEPEKEEEPTVEEPEEKTEEAPKESPEETPEISEEAPEAPKAAIDTVVVDPQTVDEVAEVRKEIKEQQENLHEPADMIIVSGV